MHSSSNGTLPKVEPFIGKSIPKVLVYGWYTDPIINVGDALFVPAFKKLFPNVQFKFTNSISLSDVKNTDAIFIGGGSFLTDEPNFSFDATAYISQNNVPVFYIGVGLDGYPNYDRSHRHLLQRAKCIATRSEKYIEELNKINPNVIHIPDMVHSLQDSVQLGDYDPKSVLVLPNCDLIPTNADPHWKHAAWEYFRSEFSQFLDDIISNGHSVKFYPFCSGNDRHDVWAATEIMSRMIHRNENMIIDTKPSDVSTITKYLSSHDVVMSQRFHGNVLCEMTRTKYVSISHHDKFALSKLYSGVSIPYYGLSKDKLNSAFVSVKSIVFKNIISNVDFESLVAKVNACF